MPLYVASPNSTKGEKLFASFATNHQLTKDHLVWLSTSQKGFICVLDAAGKLTNYQDLVLDEKSSKKIEQLIEKGDLTAASDKIAQLQRITGLTARFFELSSEKEKTQQQLNLLIAERTEDINKNNAVTEKWAATTKEWEQTLANLQQQRAGLMAALLELSPITALIPVANMTGKVGIMDQNGRLILPFNYDCATRIDEGMVALKLNEKRGFIDRTGKEIIPIKYDDIVKHTSEDGLVRVRLNGKYGLLDSTGKEITPIKYAFEYNWSDPVGIGLAAVQLNGKYGFIDRTGKEIIPVGLYQKPH